MLDLLQRTPGETKYNVRKLLEVLLNVECPDGYNLSEISY